MTESSIARRTGDATSTDPAAFPRRERWASLDGLRGVAALVVVVGHALLLAPPLIAPYRDPSASLPTGVRWLAMTPVHVLWDGATAVMVFFVLSGFVLTIALRPGVPHRWSAYYPRRLTRLYVPVLVAVGWAVLLMLLVPPPTDPRVSNWVSGHPSTWSSAGVLRDALLVVPRPGYSNPALWSLRWEVVFSLLLPLFLFFAGRGSRWFAAKVGLIALVAYVGAATGPVESAFRLGAAFQLPMFALGCLLARHWTQVLERAKGATAGQQTLGGAVAVLALSSYWLLHAFGAPPAAEVTVPAARVVQVFGAALLVALSALPGGWATLLRRPGAQWLGTRSFSLYLVHEPIVAAAGKIAGVTRVGLAVAMAGAVVVSLVVGEVFFRQVERPAHLLSQRIGHRMAQRAGRHAQRWVPLPHIDEPRPAGITATARTVTTVACPVPGTHRRRPRHRAPARPATRRLDSDASVAGPRAPAATGPASQAPVARSDGHRLVGVVRR